MKDALTKLFSGGRFPTEKNRVWTLCQCALKMAIMASEEAEKGGFTNEQFYIAFEDSLNAISVKDHGLNIEQTKEFEKSIKEFMADQK